MIELMNRGRDSQGLVSEARGCQEHWEPPMDVDDIGGAPGPQEPLQRQARSDEAGGAVRQRNDGVGKAAVTERARQPAVARADDEIEHALLVQEACEIEHMCRDARQIDRGRHEDDLHRG